MVIGVDPGAPLAMALLGKTGKLLAITKPEHVSFINKKGRTENDPVLVANIVRKWIAKAKDTPVMCVESTWARPGDSAVLTQQYVGSQSMMMGIAAALNMPCCIVSPVKWKRDLKLLGASDKKGVSVRRAFVEFPEKQFWFLAKGYHDQAEAALLAYWCRNYWLKEKKDA